MLYIYIYIYITHTRTHTHTHTVRCTVHVHVLLGREQGCDAWLLLALLRHTQLVDVVAGIEHDEREAEPDDVGYDALPTQTPRTRHADTTQCVVLGGHSGVSAAPNSRDGRQSTGGANDSVAAGLALGREDVLVRLCVFMQLRVRPSSRAHLYG